jgi:hypothetical protein
MRMKEGVQLPEGWKDCDGTMAEVKSSGKRRFAKIPSIPPDGDRWVIKISDEFDKKKGGDIMEAITKTELKALLEKLKNAVTALEALIGPDETPASEPSAVPEATPTEAPVEAAPAAETNEV